MCATCVCFVAFGMWMGYQASIMVVASTASQLEFLWGITASVVSISALICYVALDMMEETTSFLVISVNGYDLEATDVIISGYSTILAILLRNVYRRREALKIQGVHSTTVRLLAYRCTVSLQEGPDGRGMSGLNVVASSRDIPRSTASFIASVKHIPMQFVPVPLLPVAAQESVHGSRRSVPQRLQLLAKGVKSVALVLTVVSFMPQTPRGCRECALLSTLLFCLPWGSTYHRHVLRYLVFSLDFAFLTTQLTLIDMCMCDLFAWDGRVIPVVACWHRLRKWRGG